MGNLGYLIMIFAAFHLIFFGFSLFPLLVYYVFLLCIISPLTLYIPDCFSDRPLYLCVQGSTQESVDSKHVQFDVIHVKLVIHQDSGRVTVRNILITYSSCVHHFYTILLKSLLMILLTDYKEHSFWLSRMNKLGLIFLRVMFSITVLRYILQKGRLLYTNFKLKHTASFTIGAFFETMIILQQTMGQKLKQCIP